MATVALASSKRNNPHMLSCMKKPSPTEGFFCDLSSGQRRKHRLKALRSAYLCAAMYPKQKRTRIIFLLLSAYVLFQFFWWAFHIVNLHGEIRDLQLSLMPASAESIECSFQKKVWMVIGEGAVFVSLLLFGLWRIGNYLRKEAELARQERNFMLAVTHELKTPIATLRLFLDTLRSRRLPEEKKATMLNDAVNETHRLDHLVENILLSTRLDHDHEGAFAPLNLTDLVESVTAKLQRSIGQDHHFDLELSPDIHIHGDANQVESLIANLIENAVKYSPEDSHIDISLKRLDGQACFTVEDEGAGIPPHEKERIFRKFYRIGNEETRKTKGTGLGLYLVERITRRHNGSIRVQSPEGKGSTFVLCLPLLNEKP